MAYRVAVVGGGVAGAVCASVLAHGLRTLGRGGTVHLFEAAHSLGGRTSTRTVQVPATSPSSPSPTTSSSSAAAGPGGGGRIAPAIDVQYDHGAQFFRATHPQVKRFLASGLAAGLVGQWNARVGILGRRGGRFLPVEIIRGTGVLTGLASGVGAGADAGADGVVPGDAPPPDGGGSGTGGDAGPNELDFCGHLEGPPYFVGMPTMQALCEGLCERAGVVVHPSCKVTGLSWHPPTTTVGAPANGGGDGDVAWRLQTQCLGGAKAGAGAGGGAAAGGAVSAQAEEAAVEEKEKAAACFDHVVLATHSPAFAAAQLDQLLAADPGGGCGDSDDDGGGDGEEVRQVARRLSSLLAQQEHRPARTLMVTFPGPVPTDFDAAVVHGSDIIKWIARDSSKPGRPGGSSSDSGPESWVAHATDDFARRWRHIDNSTSAATTAERRELSDVMLRELQHCLHRHIVSTGDDIDSRSDGSSRSPGAAAAGKTSMVLTPLHMQTQRWGMGFLRPDGTPGAVDISAEFFPRSESGGGGGAVDQQQVHSVGFGRWDLSLCGDYFGGSAQQSVQGAMLGGLEAASRILGALQPHPPPPP